MLYAVAGVLPGMFFQGIFDGVQRHINSSISLGVNGDLVALAVRFQMNLFLILWRYLEDPSGVFGWIVGVAVDVRLIEGAGIDLDGAVAACFHSP